MVYDVSKAAAQYFYDQCCGTHNGHMANLPNNPAIKGLLDAHGVNSQVHFVEFLQEVADMLKSDNPL